jgi:maltose O-acetyltransferase
MIYSRLLVKVIAFSRMKILGALALYRFRSLIKGVGVNSRCALSVEIKFPDKIKVGDHVAIGPMCTLGGYGGIILEDYVRVSKGVTIESAGLDSSSELPYKHIGKPIVIKKGAWLGTRCIILGGVTIGEHAIIGAGAVVSKNVSAYEVVVSQQVRKIFKDVN